MTGTTTLAPAVTPQEIVERALAASRTDGCFVVVTTTDTANIRWANNTVTTNGATTGLSWYVVAIVGDCAGSVRSSSTDLADIAAVVQAAEQAARAAGPAEDAFPLFSGGADDSFGLPPERSGFEVYRTLIPGLQSAFDSARSGGRILYGFARHELATLYLGSSTGLRLRWVQPTGTLEVNAKSTDLSRSAWVGASTNDFTDVDIEAMSSSLTQRLGWAQRTVDLGPGRYRTVLPPTSVADLLLVQAWSSGARAAYEGRSPLSASGGGTRLGERISDLPIDLYSDPSQAPVQSSPFVATSAGGDELSVFDNGSPISRVDMVRGGSISGLLHTRASAAQYGDPYTPIGDNLVVSAGQTTDTLDDLVRGIDRGLLLTSLWYIRVVDPMTLLLTGLTRDGVFLIERGEVVGAVNNFRFNMSPLDVLRQAQRAGRTERSLSREWSDWFTRSVTPSLIVDDFHMSSVSQAQ